MHPGWVIQCRATRVASGMQRPNAGVVAARCIALKNANWQIGKLATMLYVALIFPIAKTNIAWM